MGEEKQPEENKPKEEEPKKEGEAPAAEAAAPPPPPPPPPPEEVEMRVFMHCEGCARKVRRSLKGFDGVEEVSTNCRTHKVVVKGKKAAEDPLKVVERVQKKTGRRVELLSPLPLPTPPPQEEKKEQEKPKAEEKKEPVVIAVVLKVHMHCEACAQEIKKRILRMEGVQSAESDLKASHVTVKGVFDPPKLIEYLHKRTSKHASIIKAEPINKKPEDEKAKEEEKGKDEKKEGNKAEGGDNKAEEEEKKADEKKVDDKAEGDKAEKEGKNDAKDEKELSPEEMAVAAAAAAVVAAAAKMEQKKNEFYYYYPTIPRYPVEYVAAYSAYPQHQYQMAYAPTQTQGYAPQIFSDENPNACSVM